ncbi:UDP-3-O-acyl-N-acetylglucosamine deacetylase [Prosthecomicrobium sp. N25]|uniref:UDP-3-O-acyl-N-acetylglucosamine deacetylase n=1 Tax=Prosthecomicrobium sp. N25 TaxID=3129254 RepID=UPI0030768DB6
MARNGVYAQTTIADTVRLVGTGVHSGERVSLALHPADAGTGIVFLRGDRRSGREIEIRADWTSVSATELCTVIGDPARGTVATIEHLMAALSGLGIDNVTVEIDGPEVPVMDGSARVFVEAIEGVGVEPLAERRRYIKVLKPIRVESGHSFAELRPHEGTRFEITIDFPNTLIGRQTYAADLTAKTFVRHVARARTFGFVSDLEKLLPLGLCRGSSLENSIAIKDDRVLNPEGLRYADEFVRHKALDAIGDLALAGGPIMGLYRSYRGGHRLNFQALAALFSDPNAWCIVEQPVRREAPVAEIGAGLLAPAFGPDVR